MKFKMLGLAFVLLALMSSQVMNASDNAIEFRFVYEQPGSNRTEYICTSLDGKEKEKLYADPDIMLSANDLESSYLMGEQEEPTYSYRINIKMTDAGKEKLRNITENNIGKRLGVFVNGKLITAPRILESIPGGELSIGRLRPKKEAVELFKTIDIAIREK